MKKLLLMVGMLLAVASFTACNGSSEHAAPYFYENQMNHATVLQSIFLTEESVYVVESGGTVARFDREFEISEDLVLHDWDNGIMSIQVGDGVIYFTLPEGDLYKHNLETGENTRLASDVYNMRLVGDTIFYMNEPFMATVIYALDLESGDSEAVVEGEVIWDYLVNTNTDTIIFNDDGELIKVSFDSEELEDLGITNVNMFTFDGEVIAWAEVMGSGFHVRDFETEEETFFENDIRVSDIFITEDRLIVRSFDHELYLIDRDSGSNPVLLLVNVMNLSVVGDYMLYNSWIDLHLHRSNFRGRSNRVFEHLPDRELSFD